MKRPQSSLNNSAYLINQAIQSPYMVNNHFDQEMGSKLGNVYEMHHKGNLEAAGIISNTYNISNHTSKKQSP